MLCSMCALQVFRNFALFVAEETDEAGGGVIVVRECVDVVWCCGGVAAFEGGVNVLPPNDLRSPVSIANGSRKLAEIFVRKRLRRFFGDRLCFGPV